MENQEQKKIDDIPIIEIDQFTWQIPECCREGWPSCPHVLKKQRPIKNNIGM